VINSGTAESRKLNALTIPKTSSIQFQHNLPKNEKNFKKLFQCRRNFEISTNRTNEINVGLGFALSE